MILIGFRNLTIQGSIGCLYNTFLLMLMSTYLRIVRIYIDILIKNLNLKVVMSDLRIS
jgi:hypothetical protein